MIKYIARIPMAATRKSILVRLGYNPHLAELNAGHQQQLENGIREGEALCNLSGVYRRVSVLERGQDYIVLENRQKFQSANLAKLLGNSAEVLVMGATVGPEVVAVVQQEMAQGNAARGVIIDAVASETVDAGLDWIMELVNQMLAKEGKKLTHHRFSPGYGDLALASQKIIYDLLDFAKLNVNMTPQYIMIPEKSVLAVAGIEENI